MTLNEEIKQLMQSSMMVPPRKAQSEIYTGPITISNYERFDWVREKG